MFSYGSASTSFAFKCSKRLDSKRLDFKNLEEEEKF